ncbi:MAG TPA: recombinase family protein [Terracidiphilus sp.]
MKYFVYCRKSSEDKHRQVLSIQSQQREAERAFGDASAIEIVAAFEEERSAMKPGRPIFASMIERIRRGEAQGIISWAPDRLARNSIDGGEIVYLLDQGIIQNLKFVTYTFENNSQGKFMLQIMFGQSKYFSDALSENVRRGLRTKLENGWWPTMAPIGYLNRKEGDPIVSDPERFLLVKEMFERMLSGVYSTEQIGKWAREIGLCTLVRRQTGGKPLSSSGVYRLFYNPFYAGKMAWGGTWYQGKHEPMITLAEFDTIQTILRRPGRPQPKVKFFSYTGLMTCGACGLGVTAEEKINRFGSHYTYYHCTKRRIPHCAEPSVEARRLDVQLVSYLESVTLSDGLHQWALRELELTACDLGNRSSAQRRLAGQSIVDLERRSDELIDMRARSLIDDGEFTTKRERMQRELFRLREALTELTQPDANWFEPAKAILSFSNRAVIWFEEGTDEERRLIINAVGSNLSLRGRRVSIQARKIFRHVPREPKIPRLSAFVRNIRIMSVKGALLEPIGAIRKLEELRAARLG